MLGRWTTPVHDFLHGLHRKKGWKPPEFVVKIFLCIGLLFLGFNCLSLNVAFGRAILFFFNYSLKSFCTSLAVEAKSSCRFASNAYCACKYLYLQKFVHAHVHTYSLYIETGFMCLLCSFFNGVADNKCVQNIYDLNTHLSTVL